MPDDDADSQSVDSDDAVKINTDYQLLTTKQQTH